MREMTKVADETDTKPLARYLLEVADGGHWCDDYLIRMFGVECFFLDADGMPDNFVVYEPVTAIHDFQPKLNTLEAFKKMKKREFKKAHKDYKNAEELAKQNMNHPSQPSPIDCQ